MILSNGITMRIDTWVTSIPSCRLDLLSVAGVVHLGVVALHLMLLGVMTLHLKLLGVDGGAVLADKGVLHLVLVPIVAVLELGEVVKAQIFSNGITMRNDTFVTSIPSWRLLGQAREENRWRRNRKRSCPPWAWRTVSLAQKS